MCAPLLPRIVRDAELGDDDGSSRRNSSLQGPVALTTIDARTFTFALRRRILDRRSGDPASLQQQRRNQRVVHHDGARLRGTDRVGQRQSRIVRRRVKVARAAEQIVRAKHRLSGEHRVAIQPMISADIPEERENVVQHERSAEFPARNPRAAVHRPRELQRSHQVRRESQQSVSLGARLEDEMHMSVLEISHPAVNQPRRPARRSTGEIALLDERDCESTEGRVARDRAAGNAAADDEDVERSRLEFGEPC